MTQDAFALLCAANPLPENPLPLPMAPLLEGQLGGDAFIVRLDDVADAQDGSGQDDRRA